MNKKQQKLFDSVLVQIPHDGWTAQAVKNGAKAAHISLVEARQLFPRGIDDVADAFHALIDDEMMRAIKGSRKFTAMRVRDKITFAVKARMEALADYRHVIPRFLVWGLMPQNIRAAAKHLWRVADRVWNAAGDTSTDYNYYTKRILLMAVMKSTLAFWLNDQSPSCRETWAFLDRRIADVMMLGKGIGVIKTVGISDIASFMRSQMRSRFAA